MCSELTIFRQGVGLLEAHPPRKKNNGGKNLWDEILTLEKPKLTLYLSLSLPLSLSLTHPISPVYTLLNDPEVGTGETHKGRYDHQVQQPSYQTLKVRERELIYKKVTFTFQCSAEYIPPATISFVPNPPHPPMLISYLPWC